MVYRKNRQQMGKGKKFFKEKIHQIWWIKGQDLYTVFISIYGHISYIHIPLMILKSMIL